MTGIIKQVNKLRFIDERNLNEALDEFRRMVVGPIGNVCQKDLISKKFILDLLDEVFGKE